METKFRQTRWRSGYSPQEVDDFVAKVENALRSPAPQLSATDVAQSRFTPVQLKPGYHMDDVDHYLEKAQQKLSEQDPRR
jgi:DivIVA domain-containing protein